MHNDAVGRGAVRPWPARHDRDHNHHAAAGVPAGGDGDRRRAVSTREARPADRWLNLGCGTDHIGHALNVDIDPGVAPDVVVDLQQTPWPWADNAFERVVAYHILEHLDPVPWSEIARVLVPGGTLTMRYPIGRTRFEDGSHRQFWTVSTAEWIVGDTKHQHEAPLDGTLLNRHVDWTIRPRAPLKRLRTKLYERVFGPGDWMSQVTGLYGEVHASVRLVDRDR